MPRLVVLGSLSALFFSSTFIFNRAISLAGGHWFWTASLRYVWMLALLMLWYLCSGKMNLLGQIFGLFKRNWIFWCLTGSIGFGIFYSLIAFSSGFAPGWVVATTWQMTILASPLVLLLFGKKVPLRALLYTLLIFCGILLVNLGQSETVAWQDLLWGGLPVLVAAFAYPLGNQMLWEAQRQGTRRIPHIKDQVLEDPFARIMLLTLGTIPFWVLLYLLMSPPPPAAGQWTSTFLVALLSGVVATSLFLYARNLAGDSYEIAAIDSLQSGEVLFSLAGEILFLNGSFPATGGTVGVILTVVGLGLYMRAQVDQN
ncbi:DMT family transporter [Pelobacter seleniigenes]|uniref:DMT family transporter n=1 Tax=Pelobacter seleniigenes TaxID=407188 RepID=UPI0004A77C55|nr:multidrug resistance efflux transporter family protein [Pelobacter seleniigenes]